MMLKGVLMQLLRKCECRNDEDDDDDDDDDTDVIQHVDLRYLPIFIRVTLHELHI